MSAAHPLRHQLRTRATVVCQRWVRSTGLTVLVRDSGSALRLGQGSRGTGSVLAVSQRTKESHIND